MLDAIHISASSMDAHQVYVDVIANNLSNVNTSGFKKSAVQFSDLMYSRLQADANDSAPSAVGKGTSVNSVLKVFSQGDAKNTERRLDVAIQGSGFLEVMLPNGEYAYTRFGQLNVNSDGQLVTADGNAISPSISIPPDATDIVISESGQVLVAVPNQQSPYEAGSIELADFVNASGLNPLGNNLYQATDASGDAFYGLPGEDQFGGIEQGFLEGSNVDLIEELSGLMLAQRGYEMNAKVLQTADELLGIVNNLRR